MPEPHRINFTTGASTAVDVPNTGQTRDEAIEQAYADLDTGLCHHCSSKVELGDFEAEEDRYDPTAEMRTTLDAVRALATTWVNQPNVHHVDTRYRQAKDGRDILALLDGKAGA
ncbi:hypothetical protein ACTWPB_07495 [Nocardia sp. IBHARD005]|uniref:hypothetical protein n=1 Tax=Nocardia sp. IBHARD005 TaxID=3457765 RepID=UPI004058F5E9